jgi:hypothetical protein
MWRISSTICLERLLGPPVLPSSGYQHSFLGVQVDHPAPRLIMSGAKPLLPLYALLRWTEILSLLVRATVTVFTPTVITAIFTKIYTVTLQHTVLCFYIQLPLVGKLAQWGRQVQHSPTHATESQRRTSTEIVAYKRTHTYNYKVNSKANTVQASWFLSFRRVLNVVYFLLGKSPGPA